MLKDLFGRFCNSEDESLVYTGPTKKWLVTSETPRIETPENFVLKLKIYQRATIYSMHQMETYKTFTTESRDYYSCAGVLSNALGSGKTATILGLISHNPVPSYGPMYPVTIDYFASATTNKAGFGSVRGVLLKKFSVVHRPALIFTGYGVLRQWEGEVTKFNPSLKCFVVDGVHSLKTFYKLVHSDRINSYDLILIKNKTISGEFKFEHDELAESIVDYRVRSIYNIVCVMCRNMCFTRVIVDDFDTIGVPGLAGNLNALFTWFVSSTEASICRKIWHNKEHTDIRSLVHHNNIVYSDITQNKILYNLFNIHADPEFYKAYISVGIPRFFLYKFRNPSGKVLDLINCMTGDKVSEIMEALNGDAIDEAARLAGIEASDPNQIFKLLLQKNYESLAESRDILDKFKKYFNRIDLEELPPFKDNPDQDDTYTRRDVRAARPLEWRYPGIKTLLNEEEEKWTAVYKECTQCLEKFKSAVKNNECQVCCCELDDPDENYCILPCCHEIIHAECAVRGCNFRKESRTVGDVIIGNCPFDKSHVVFMNKLCYIKSGFDLNQIDESKFVDAESPVVASSTPDSKRERTKFDAIVDLIKGLQPPEQTRINISIPNLLLGDNELSEAAYLTDYPSVVSSMEAAGYNTVVAEHIAKWTVVNWKPRVLVFANFDETLDKVTETLKTNNINFERLGGHQRPLRETVMNFDAGRTDVLLINSTAHCSSLNLQVATDLIFTHRIIDPHIESQVTGRIQREGRSCNARIHFIMYENEATHLQPDVV